MRNSQTDLEESTSRRVYEVTDPLVHWQRLLVLSLAASFNA